MVRVGTHKGDGEGAAEWGMVKKGVRKPPGGSGQRGNGCRKTRQAEDDRVPAGFREMESPMT